MSLYTFYCCKADGTAITFSAAELSSLEDAAARTSRLLEEHLSCAKLLVFRDDVNVLVLERDGLSPEPFDQRVTLSSFDPQALGRMLNTLPSEEVDVAIIATTPEGTIAYWNKPAERLYGWTTTEALGANVVDLKATDESRSFATEVMARLQAGLSWTGEIKLKRRDGSEFQAFAADLPLGRVENGHGLIVGASADAARRQAVEDFQPSMLAVLRQARLAS